MILKNKKNSNIIIFSIIVIFLSLIGSYNILNLKVIKWDTKQYLMSYDLGFSSSYMFTGDWSPNLYNLLKNSKNKFQKFINYKFTKSKFQKMEIEIPYKAFKKIMDDRKKAIKLGLLTNPSEVKADIIFNNKKYKVRIRLKGDAEGHWMSQYRMSLRVHVLNGLTILGNSKFSITKPIERNHPYDMVFQKLITDMKNIAPNHQFVKLIVNGQNWGIMDIEEHMSPVFLEKQQLKNSPIVKFSNEKKWVYKLKNASDRYAYYRISDPSLYIHLYDFKKSLEDINNRKIFTYISKKHLNYDYDLYDYKSFSNAFLLASIWNWHTLNSSNLRYYFNPFTLKLEVITTDQTIISKNLDDQNIMGVRKDQEMLHFHKILNEKEYKKNLNDNIKKIGYTLKNAQDYFNNYGNIFPLDNKVNAKILEENINKVTLNKDKYLLNLYNKNNFKDQLNYNFKKPTKNQSNNFDEHVMIRHFDNGDLFFYNLLPDEVNVKKILFKEYDLEFKEFKIPSYFLKNEPVKIKTNILGFHDESFTVITEYKNKIANSQNYITLVSKNINNPLISNKNLNLNFIIKSNDNYIIKQGNWNVKKPLIINGNLKISANTKISFSKDAYLIVNGKIDFQGTKDKPIVLNSISEKWKGIYVYGSKEKSYMKNINISNLDELNDGILNLTGGINFYKSNIEIDNLMLKNSFGEDSINIIKSIFLINNLKIENSYSDAIDLDYSDGRMVNSFFKNIKGDAVDISGSNVELDNIEIKNVNDKGISIGENTSANINNIDIFNARIGIASKDGSNSVVNNCIISNSLLVDVISFIKKDFYKPPKINLNDCNLKSKNKFLSQKGTTLIVDEKKIDGKNINIKNLYNQI